METAGKYETPKNAVTQNIW